MHNGKSKNIIVKIEKYFPKKREQFGGIFIDFKGVWICPFFVI